MFGLGFAFLLHPVYSCYSYFFCVFPLGWYLLVSTKAIDCLEGLIPE